MTKNEMRISLKLINSYMKKEYPNINEVIIENYEPLISDYILRFRIITYDNLKFSERYYIGKRLETIFNMFGYNMICGWEFQYKSSE